MTTRWDGIGHFKPEEFANEQSIRFGMVRMLDELREQTGVPIVITSSYRDSVHNASVGGVQNSSHCLAPDGFYSGVDFSIEGLGGGALFKLITTALALGFKRIGIYPKHLHLDIEDDLPQNVIWIGKD
jgi:uncharacterized protein YcbK (DUF882 family)